MTDEDIFNADITDNDLLAILNKPTKKTKQTRQYTEEAQVAMKERLKRMREKSIETRKANAEIKKETPNIKPSKKDTNERMIELLGTMNSNMSELVKMKQSKAVQPKPIEPIQSQPQAVQQKPIEPIQPKPIQVVQSKPVQPVQPKPIAEPVIYNYPYPLKNKIISKY
jgi:hypothetical protein